MLCFLYCRTASENHTIDTSKLDMELKVHQAEKA